MSTHLQSINIIIIIINYVEKFQVSLKSDKNNGNFTFSIISRLILLRIKNISDKRCSDTQNTHVAFSTLFFFSKIVPFMRYVEKYCRAGQATDDSMAHAHSLLNT